jgi:hypothetical protein
MIVRGSLVCSKSCVLRSARASAPLIQKYIEPRSGYDFWCVAGGVASRPSGAQIYLMMSGKFERMEPRAAALVTF